MNFKDIFDLAIEKDASDMIIRVNSSLRGKVHSRLEVMQKDEFREKDVEKIIADMTSESERKELKANRSYEFTYWYKELWRFRISIFYQRNTPALVIRKINLSIPSFADLDLPENLLKKFCTERRGLILLTGITGSGKSTTIASIIEHINKNYGRHVLTVEEPIEFTFKDNKSIINQREIGKDVRSYKDALRQFALHSPDVIYIGNIRDNETCHAALAAAETGVLVFSTIHTVNAASTIERIVNFFPPHQHDFILNQLSFLLKGVLTQRLIPRADESGLIPAYEAMTLSPSISRLMRENKVWEIPKYIASGDVYGMKTFHQCLLALAVSGKISPQIALEYCDKKEELEMELRTKGLLK